MRAHPPRPRDSGRRPLPALRRPLVDGGQGRSGDDLADQADELLLVLGCILALAVVAICSWRLS